MNEYARYRAELVCEADELGDPAARARRLGAERGPRDHVAGQVRDGAAQVLVADVQAEHVARLRADLIQHSGTARHAGPLPGLAHQAGALDIGQRQRHCRLGQAGQPRELCARATAELADVLEQEAAHSAPAAAAVGRPGRPAAGRAE